MKRLTCGFVHFLCILWLMLCVSAKADTLADNFRQGISSQLWTNYNSVYPSTASLVSWDTTAPITSSGGLRISKAADADTSSWLVQGGLESLFALDGDLTISVVIDELDYTPIAGDTGGVTGGLGIISTIPGGGSCIISTGLSVSHTPTTMTGVPVAIRRTGQAVEFSGDGGNSWMSASGQVSGPVNVVLVACAAGSPFPRNRPHCAFTVDLNDFSAVADTITVPEPTALFLFAFSTLAFLWRKAL